MTGASVSTSAAMLLQFSLGLAVFQANRRRLANQCFLLLSLAVVAWLGSLLLAFGATTPQAAEFAIRQASAAGAVYLAILNFLRLSIRQRQLRWKGLLAHSKAWLFLTILVVILCQTAAFLKGAVLSEEAHVPPRPEYGPAVWLYSIYIIAAFSALIISYWHDIRNSKGAERVELSFIFIGAIAAVVSGLLLSFVLDYFLGPSRALWFAPFRMIGLSFVMAYGIATRKILEVGFFMRRAISYGVLAVYLIALYALIFWLCYSVFVPLLGSDGLTLAHVIASVVVAFAMAPARGVSRSLAERLFVGTRRLDFQATMNQATAILRSVTTLGDLLERFGLTIGQAVDTERVFILLPEPDFYAQRYPAVQAGSRTTRVELHRDQAIIAHLERTQEPIVVDELHRVPSTVELERVKRQMNSLQIAVAMGIFSRENLAGVMLLGARRSGLIYGKVEQDALRVLCGQLAVAIENAQLFTEVQNAKIYNETLLQNLTTGVVAADQNGLITVFNQEVEQITGLPASELIARKISNLPDALRDILTETLSCGERQQDREIVLRRGDKNTILRASSSIFHGQDNEPLGALMVLTDISMLKRLEQQIRRSDRLASLGTLSAGMAHEIKNPLVSIKTFAQLLPERYQDSDFRETFFSLIGHEVDRIDSLVNQLLRFARPAKPLLKPMHVHEVLEKALLLVGHRLYQKDVKLTRSWQAEVDTIRADADQIEQVFLNFFLNALDAMKSGGSLTVATEIGSPETWPAALPGDSGDVQEILRITIADDGGGIKPEDVAHVFDPFFTTKDHGTGLGLSVVHGIVQEHGGQIEVESELARGTSFHILLPLVRFQEEVAAA
ncbi:MAG TPA: ATP-binding protein [Chthoniobacterales bacterium]|nr:ATP-binding protein [Chthoniobacterales bacterium]